MEKKVKLLKDVMTKRVVTIPPTLSIREISKIMAEEAHPQVTGDVVMGRYLSEPQMPVGIISASDIVKEIGKDDF